MVDGPSRYLDPLRSFSAGLFAIAVAIGLFTGIAAYGNITQQDAVYQSTAVMLIDQPKVIAIGNEGAVVKLNLLRPKYLALLTTPDVVNPAARRAGVTPAFMAASERPSAPQVSTLSVFPIIRAKDRLLAQRMAQALAESLQDYVIDEQTDAKLSPDIQIELRIIEPAHVGRKVSPDPERARQVGAVFGVGGLLVSYAVLQLIRSRRTA